MEIEINDEKYQKEVGKLKQLDRIEFRQKRGFYAMQLNDNYNNLGLGMIMFLVIFAIGLVACLFSTIGAILFFILGVWFLVEAIYVHNKNKKLIESNMMDHLKEWLNINDVI